MINFYGLSLKTRGLIILLTVFSSIRIYSQAIGITSPVATGSYCAGTTVNVTFTITGTFSNTPTANVFSVQVSDDVGSFAGSPVTIGTRTSITAGTVTCTIPSTLLTSGFYRFRILSSNPPINGSDNGADLTIVSISLNAPTLAQTSFCQSETITVNFTQSSCNFVNTPATNVYSVELSNAAGSFSSPAVIGTRTAVTAAAITCTIPPGTPAGSGYRMRITASSPAVSGPDNGSNLAVMAASGTPTVFGNGKWNVYCYNTRNDYGTNYQGTYSENALSFNTTTRWSTTQSPSSANGTGGTAYAGCIFPATNASFVYKRTNIPCGYYQIDIPAHRNEVYLIINGITVFSHTAASGDSHTNVWTGLISTSDEIEIRCSTLTGTGNLQVTFTKLNQITMSAPITVCASSNATLTVTNTGTLPVTYSWIPSASLSPSTGSVVVATPTTSTTYTVLATSTGSACLTFTNTVLVTVNPVPTTATSISSATICSGFSSANITATGANTYSWSPATGLNTTTGNLVVASPTVTTVYTVTGSNNCTTSIATRSVIVRTPPSSPSPTVFGTNSWNVFCYNGTSQTNLFGVYTETLVNFNTVARWASGLNPSNANATGGTAYTGCFLGNSNYGFVAKRQGFPCGYYSISINHDDLTTLLINGVSVFSHTGTDLHTNTWTGFLGPSSTAEYNHINNSGATSLLQTTVAVSPIPILSPPVTICIGTSATLTANQVSGISYSWSPPTNLSTTTGTLTLASPTVGTNYTCTVTHAATSCSSAATTSVSINPLPTTSVSPVSATINCSSQIYTLSVSGANTYSWSPSAGLSATTGNSVIASPTVNTTYTVTGNNNCASLSATTNINVVPLVNPTVFPIGTWNAYCYNTTTFTITNYYGYYTENGSGPSGYDFNTTTRWASGASPSTTSTVNGQAYLGCTMPATQWNMSFRRTGFTCNTYTIFPLSNDESLTIFINGIQVASRATSASSAALWVGVLSPTTTVELRLVQTTGPSGLNIRFTPSTSSPTPATWAGIVNSNWFNTANWCGGALPTISDNVIIPNSGTLFQPVIGASGAICNDITIQGAQAAVSGSTSAIPAASLTVSGAFGLDVYGHWNGYGTFTAGSGTVSMLGSSSQNINCSTSQTFNRLVLNTAGGVIFSPGTHRIATNLNFILGIADLDGSLHFLNGATATNASNISYIDGAIVKFGNQAFTFPIGTGGLYRPISISAPALTTDNFTAQYFNVDASPPFTYSLTDVSIHHISRCEYWILNRSGGSSVVRVTLSWDVNSCGVADISKLLVARWDAGQVKWKDHGNGGTTGNTAAGTLISSSPVTVFSPFTLGTSDPVNILPVELIDFTANCIAEGIELKWSTATEKNNDYFIIENSKDGLTWQEVKKIYAGASSYSRKNYSFVDRQLSNETIYYRLGQVDKDQTRKNFKVLASSCGAPLNEFKFFPNPVANEINLFFNLSDSHNGGTLTITDQLGKVSYTRALDLKRGNNNFTLPLKLNPGIYFIAYSSDTFKSAVQKLVVE
jgi:hypothetical protein